MYNSIDSIKNGASSSLYLQVTGTPQSIFLQTKTSRWHPMFNYYFKPGKGYLGGDFFFQRNGNPDSVTFIDGLKNPEWDMVIRHILVSAQMLLSGKSVCNCLVHPSVKQDIHQKFADRIKKNLIGADKIFQVILHPN